ncbi:coproporphyrinogen dehydrogenase HemZ [Anaerostipes sp.]|uniref:coproporphyrinogen dehydrogenase HemZ n=1 Tax=Anaerostipes sp. TaxID=1872530 RepID=UPI0025BE1FEE|nr:coproporphyrinogen dehydrogenase HemZ [Anaerostipes sp.]MBS7009281.1 coproporphyrinogen dehydrogenase HemZ [Anaerostipes sp.]
MIGLIQNETLYEYDIRSLILAFCIGEKIELSSEENDNSIYDFICRVFYGEPETLLELRAGEAVLSEKVKGDYKDKKSFKNGLKAALYRLLSGHLKKELPWGTLNGIRPTKLVFEDCASGRSREEMEAKLRNDYLVSREKAQLCVSVAQKETELLGDISYTNGYSLYVGIPFCPSTCLYCSFTSYPISAYKEYVDQYLDALIREIRYVGSQYRDRPLVSLYVGGGTPTTLSPKQLERLLRELRKCFDFSRIREITVEAGRPDSITGEKLSVLFENGVTRISINPQTMNNVTLKRIGRNHTAEEVAASFEAARKTGFDNINMDTICGLPGEGEKELETTFAALGELKPDSITVHALAIKRSAPLNQLRDQYSFGADEQMIQYAQDACFSMGMEPYYLYRQKNIPGNFENIGFSLEEKECLYNILIMEELHDIIAVGAGASSKILGPGRNIQRVENLKDVRQYTERISEMILRKDKLLKSMC